MAFWVSAVTIGTRMKIKSGLKLTATSKLLLHQEPWKAPLPLYIECLYRKRFGRERPVEVLSVEGKLRRDEKKKARRREAKLQRKKESGEGE